MKYEIGSQWKTRGGHRAVVVGKEPEDDSLIIWCERKTSIHNIYGEYHSSSKPDDRDLIEPWKEPVVHEVWLDIYNKGEGLQVILYDDEKMGRTIIDKSSVAYIKVKFEEGDGLD